MLSVELVSLPIFGADSFSRVDQVFDHSPQTYEQMRFACDFWGTDEHHSYFTLTHTLANTHTQLKENAKTKYVLYSTIKFNM